MDPKHNIIKGQHCIKRPKKLQWLIVRYSLQAFQLDTFNEHFNNKFSKTAEHERMLFLKEYF